ncbi:Alpha/beta hydrolase family-domain-containing protein [Rhizoctonia solani]|nr:Alpha/beta hydrolase family-domain-containing protein [Rhizoctonia solani]
MLYPPPSTPTPRGTTAPRALIPLAKSEKHGATPSLATISRTLLPGWTCSTHVFQAATPRESAPPGPTARGAASVPAEISKAERQALTEARFNEIKELREAIYFGAKTFPVNDATMWTVANRYTPEKPRVGAGPTVTIVLSHGTGFHKEIWETTLKYLLSTPQGQANIDEIWALDAANHGDSGLLNKDSLGEIFEWSDHARDIINFLANFMPEQIENQVGSSLPRVSDQSIQRRLKHGFANRTVVGIGHSFGGTALARAVIDSPRLFSSILLLDPVISPSYAHRGPRIDALVKGTLTRRDHWPDREAAKSGLLKSPFFRSWHPDVLADYIKYGTIQDDQGVRLKCSGYQEAVTFGEKARVQCDVWELLPTLDERIPIRWAMDSTASTPVSVTGGPELTQHTVWRRPANSSNTQIKGAGHLIPHEAPEPLAQEILEFIQTHHVAKPKL